ncbi:hypothetical protein [Mycolicibacterium iranicum]|uniref:Helix-turn-helix domain-containing protein n=1 Tax=Mycolicibacterium iranicum TaxID=912594 RepID=A0ABT4HKG5_MYCIR|nr:hypothetical protein [Mycolicibacterium iranicum]MCZ0730473.1 hypothetical protein [Mycolicibacterium iranicum]
MSGRLVGEVLDACEAGVLAKLSQGELLALLAVAEKCHTETRQGSVRVSRIAAAMCKSDATAKRATRTLRDLGLLREVKRGYKSHGVGHATIYEIALLGSPRMTPAGGEELGSLRVSRANVDDESTDRTVLGSPIVSRAPDDVLGSNPDVLSSFRAGAGITQGDLHDGLYDGLNDGSTGGEPKSGTSPGDLRSLTNEPPRKCPKHIDDPTPPDCGRCKDARIHHEKWSSAQSPPLAARDEKALGWLTLDMSGAEGVSQIFYRADHPPQGVLDAEVISVSEDEAP